MSAVADVSEVDVRELKLDSITVNIRVRERPMAPQSLPATLEVLANSIIFRHPFGIAMSLGFIIID